MASWKRFEDIEAWEKARILAKTLFLILNQSELKHEYELKSQLKRSVGSVMDNIAEGFERGGNREFIQFLSIAKGSNAEVRSQLYRLFDNNFISKKQFDNLYKESENISKMITGLIKYLRDQKQKGYKFKEDQEDYSNPNDK